MPNGFKSRKGIFSGGLVPSLRRLARPLAAASALTLGLLGTAHASQVTLDTVSTSVTSCADNVATVNASITVNGANSNRMLVAVLGLADNLNDSSADIADANVGVSDSIHGAFTRASENLGSSTYGGTLGCVFINYQAYRATEIFVLNPNGGVNGGAHTVSANFTNGNRVRLVRLTVYSLYNVVNGPSTTYVTGNAGGTGTAAVNYSLALPTTGYLVISGLSCLDGRTLTATSSGAVATTQNSFCSNGGCQTAAFSSGNAYSPTPPSGSFAVTWTMSASNSRWSSAGIGLPPANYAPTNISLSNNSLAENVAAGSTVGTFSTTDPDTQDTSFTYSFAVGGPDNSSFTITGNTLKLTPSPDFETKSSYNVTIRTTDAGGLFFDKTFVINITDVNEAPTNINLSSAAINEGSPINSVVGTLSTVDSDIGQSYTYTLGGTDAASFTISGNQLRTSSVFDFEVKSSYSITISSTDNGSPNLSVLNVPFTINVIDVQNFTVSPLAYSFGGQDVFSGATASQDFIVTNERPTTVNISSTSISGADAGQFAITGGGGAVAVPSNTSHIISVNFDPNAPKGAKNALLVVLSNDPVSPALGVALDGVALAPELSVSNPSNFGLQDIDLGQTATQDIIISNSGTSAMTVSNVSISGDFVITNDTGETTLAPAATRTVTVAFDPTVVGARTGALTVTHNGTNTASPTDVALAGTGTNNQLTIAPSTIDFNGWEIDAGPKGTQTITITNSRSTSVTINSITLTITQGVAPFVLTGNVAAGALAPGASRTVDIDFDPSIVGIKAGYVTITSTDVSVPTFQVDLSGVGTDQELGYSPLNHDFATRDLDLGPTLSQAFTLTNVGTAPLTINGATITGPDALEFAIFSEDITSNTLVAPGDFRTVRVNFDPATLGPKSATLEVSTDDVNHYAAGLATMALSGIGTNNTIDISDGTHDFGDQDIDDGATTSFPVIITNARNVNLIVSNVALLDGTTGFAIAGDTGTNPQTLAPNETRTISVTFNPSVLGSAADTLRITSNDPTFPTYDVTLNGNGTDQNMQLDTLAIGLGQRDIDLGPSAAQSVTITNTGTAPLTLSSISITLNAADFSILSGDGAGTLAPGDTRVVEVQFDPTTTGAKTGTLTIVSDDTHHTATQNVALTGTGTNNQLTVDVSSIPFGSQDVDAGPTASTTVTITNNRSTNVTVNSISLVPVSGENAYSLTGSAGSSLLAPGDSRTIDVSFDPSLVGASSNKLRVSSTDASSPTIDVTLTGTGTDQQISALPSPLAFGSHDVDLGPVTLPVTITNTGTSDLSITDTILTGDADFSILSGGGSALIAPSGTRTIQIQFYPSSVAAKTGSLEIDSDDANHTPVVTIAISGTGTDNKLGYAPSSLNFGTQNTNAGPTASQTVTFTNYRNTSVQIQGVSLTGADAGEFAITAVGATPITVTAGGTANVSVAFDPSTSGSKSANLHVTTNDPAVLTADIALSGAGNNPTPSATPTPNAAQDWNTFE